MNFNELEKIMATRDITTLADIARSLNATPQSVSNWKARDQVPYHIVAKVKGQETDFNSPPGSKFTANHSRLNIDEETTSISDILLTIAEQLKVIIIIPFITVFLTFTYVQFIQQPMYLSSATILLPSNSSSNLGGLAGLATQFGVNMPTSSSADLSNPSLFPQLLRSRIFAEKILEKKFYSKEHGKILPLLAILTHGAAPPKVGRDTLVTQALASLRSMVKFTQGAANNFSVIEVTASEPILAKEMAETVLMELEALNRFFKSQTVNEKIVFIEQRIATVKAELEASEQALKAFNEQNRQISSPALKLNQERLARNVEVQKGIFLTLKQQFELAKIEEVQEASIVQVLDKPQTPLGPSNKNLRLNIFLATALGTILGIIIGFIRSYMNQGDIDERRKLRRVRNFLKKKGKDIIFDRRISGLVTVLLLMGLPYYLGHKSQNPTYFGMYSANLMLVNTVYILIIISSASLFIYLSRRKG